MKFKKEKISSLIGGMMRVKKGTIVTKTDVMNYVVVHVSVDPDGGAGVHCICDNANNIYFLTMKQLSEGVLFDPKDFDSYEKRYSQTMEVVGEVLSGQHDDRFTHQEERDEV